jgi:FimV-like protein
MSKLKLLRTVTLIYLTAIQSPATTNQAPSTYGPIKTGEMLWEIAAKVRPDPAITRHQVMIALLKANPHAFRISCNINSLKTAQTLLIPALAEMQTTGAAAAEKEYYRQNNEWKAYRRQKGPPIVCPPVVPTTTKSAESAEIAEPILSAIKTAFSNTTPERSAVTPSTSSTAKEVPNTSQNKTAPTFSQALVNSISLWMVSQSPWSIILVLMIILFFIVFLIGWLLHKQTTKKALPQETRYDLNEKPWHFGPAVKIPPTEKTTLVSSSSVPEETTFTIDSSQPLTESREKTEDIKEKFAYIRTYLAEGEERAVQRLLKEVVEKGTIEQQEEAQQLIDISKKMSTLELRIAKSQQLSVPNTATLDNSSLQTVVQAGKQTPLQQYLPENKAKVFDLIDKIFELLDRELNAQGRLMEAYLNRHKPNFFEAEDYSVLKKSEKVVVDQEEEILDNLQTKSRPEPKPTRHL